MDPHCNGYLLLATTGATQDGAEPDALVIGLAV
jgi:hypothetical protein